MRPSAASFSLILTTTPNNRKPPPEASPPRPLSSIIAQNEIRQQNLEYQQLLIRRKELEIAAEDKRNQYEALAKRRRKAEKMVEDAVARRDQAILDCKEKRCYLQRYYEELDRKFRGGREDLFASLTRLEHTLLEVYQRDQKRLRESLAPQQQEFNRLVSLVGVERERREILREQLEQMQEARDEALGIKRFGEDKCVALRKQNAELRAEIQRMNRVKKALEGEERVLKRVQNVEEDHRRHSVIIQNGIKKMFSVKLKESKYKQATSPEYSKNLQGLRDITAKKVMERDSLQRQIADKKVRFEKVMKEAKSLNEEYKQLEDKLIKQQNI